jgi:hypothetical protein
MTRLTSAIINQVNDLLHLLPMSIIAPFETCVLTKTASSQAFSSLCHFPLYDFKRVSSGA